MHKVKRDDRMDRDARELSLDELRQIWAGGDAARQIIDKYNQTAKGIIDSIGR
jgi:hypothetical protein